MDRYLVGGGLIGMPIVVLVALGTGASMPAAFAYGAVGFIPVLGLALIEGGKK